MTRAWSGHRVPIERPTSHIVGGRVAAKAGAERKRAAQSIAAVELRFRILADQLPQIVWIAGPDGRVHYYNGRVAELSGVRQGGDGSWSWEEAIHPDDRPATIEAWAAAVREQTPYEVTHRLKRADGTVRWYLSRGVPVRQPHGPIAQWFGTTTDIDSQKRTENALRDADRHKNEFLAWLSHELRNPCNVVNASLAVVERARADSEYGQRALSVIKRQVRQMGRLLDDLLDMTRVSKGKILLRRQPVELNEVVRTVGEDYRPVFALEGIDFNVRLAKGSLAANIDSVRIAQVIGNLLHNAVKFTPRGGHVTLSLQAGKHKEGVIQVRDDGAGIAPDVVARIFEPLVQDDRTVDRSRGGLGLGLALVKALVQLHGGTVSASSHAPGRGAVFTIRLPLE